MRLVNNKRWFPARNQYLVKIKISQNYNIKHPHSFNGLKDDGSSSTTCSKCLQTWGGLPQIHGCYQNTKEDLERRGQYIIAAKTVLTSYTRQEKFPFFCSANLSAVFVINQKT